MITNLDAHLTVPIDYAADLIDTLDLLCEVLRYASDELREDIVDRYQPGTYEYLIETVDAHAGALRRATSPGQPRTVTR
ncbi:MAG TPA: hypothetical protein VEO01_38645 [Pseudonocardiaceae bacterium]|nr:hypothetical protein [Pseudonocardiaceae bacterium]